MFDLCRIIIGIVLDLFRPRAALEAEILVLRQPIIVLRRGRPSRGSVTCFRKPAVRSPSFDLIPGQRNGLTTAARN